jgi:type I restriction-modification system DNA methylase subunit
MTHAQVTSFIWSAAHLTGDTFNRGKYQDVILALTVLRRIKQFLEPTKQKLELIGKPTDAVNEIPAEHFMPCDAVHVIVRLLRLAPRRGRGPGHVRGGVRCLPAERWLEAVPTRLV